MSCRHPPDQGQQAMIEFRHQQAAHCESGVMVNLLYHHGLDLSEAMVFGLGAGLFFGYLPFIRLHGLPLVTYRAAPGSILKKIAAIPGVRLHEEKFRRPEQAMDALDSLLEQNIPVGLQTGVFWLPYFPRALRFHFNAHNLVVYGRQGDEYLISDPVFPGPVRCPRQDLVRARFASGALAPRGKLYYLEQTPPSVDCASLVPGALRVVCRRMLSTPFPLIGIRGIRFLAARLENWPRRLGRERALLHVGHVIRMQEEIGTGGGGFRFMYAAFLEESGRLLASQLLLDCAGQLTLAGDRWRDFAVVGARLCKGREREGDSFAAMAEILRSCARREERVFRDLASPDPAR